MTAADDMASTHETPMDIDESSSDSGIGLDNALSAETSLNQSTDLSFEFVNSLAASGNTVRTQLISESKAS